MRRLFLLHQLKDRNSMNPQQSQQIASSVILYALGILGTALVTKGVLTQDQANALIPELAVVIIAIGSIAIGYWQVRQHSPAAVAQAISTTPAVAAAAVHAVNSDAVPGVMVVSDKSLSEQVIIDDKGNVRPDPSVPPAKTN
jgi:hypothetical protein